MTRFTLQPRTWYAMGFMFPSVKETEDVTP